MKDTTITEAEYLAFIRGKLAELVPQFPEVRDLSVLSISHDKVTLWGYFGDGYINSITGEGANFTEAAAALRAKIPGPADRAAKLRKEAADKLAEAEKLCPAA